MRLTQKLCKCNKAVAFVCDSCLAEGCQSCTKTHNYKAEDEIHLCLDCNNAVLGCRDNILLHVIKELYVGKKETITVDKLGYLHVITKEEKVPKTK